MEDGYKLELQTPETICSQAIWWHKKINGQNKKWSKCDTSCSSKIVKMCRVLNG